jgi:hypothetical protein
VSWSNFPPKYIQSFFSYQVLIDALNKDKHSTFGLFWIFENFEIFRNFLKKSSKYWKISTFFTFFRPLRHLKFCKFVEQKLPLINVSNFQNYSSSKFLRISISLHPKYKFIPLHQKTTFPEQPFDTLTKNTLLLAFQVTETSNALRCSHIICFLSESRVGCPKFEHFFLNLI